jgi:hypothetical protein
MVEVMEDGDAQAVRGDARQVQARRDVGQGREGQGGEDLQRAEKARVGARNAQGARWGQAQVEKVMALHEAGLTFAEIAGHIPFMTRNAVAGLLWRRKNPGMHTLTQTTRDFFEKRRAALNERQRAQRTGKGRWNKRRLHPRATPAPI